MHRLVSPFILCQQASGQTEGRLEGAALFADIAGFSTITSTLMEEGQNGAEALAILMRAIYEPIVAAVYSQGGFITSYAGDAFMALFPEDATPWQAEPPTASAAQRAVAAAWTIRQHIIDNPRHETPYAAFEVAVKQGLAAGEVTWGIIQARDEGSAAFYFRGQPIDGCAGAEKFSGPNEVILAPSVQGALTDIVSGESIEDHLRVNEVNGSLPDPCPADLSSIPYELQALFYPDEVINQEYSGEFRHSINVFINLEGNPKGQQFNDIVQTILKLQGHYGGLINTIDFGDKGCNILLFWGAPVSYENDVERALDFVLALQDASSLSLRAGVTMSIAHAGFIGASLHEDYACFGNGVNMAARLMVKAPWDSIWVDEGISEQSANAFDIEFEHSQEFKGFADEQSVYVLLGRKHVDVEAFYHGKLVGRDREIESLERFLAPLLSADEVERFAGIALITGDIGQGKSRLVHEIELALDKEGQPSLAPQWFVCQTDNMLRQPLNPFRYWLRNYFDQSVTHTTARNKRSFSRRLGQLSSSITDTQLKTDLEQAQSFLGALVDLHWENSLYDQLDPQGRGENLMRALKTLLLAESRRRPAILFVEDVDWLDDESREVLQRLTRNVAAYPLALICTARDRSSAGWMYGLPGVNIQTIPLANFGPDDLADLTLSVLGKPANSQLISLLNDRTGGNPFFAEQLLRFLQEEGLLIEAGDVWGPHPDALNSSRVPANVRHLFTVQLDGLTADVREVVQTAAVLGREFEVEWLQAMLPDTESLQERLTVAEQAEVVTGLSRMQYIFRSMLLRDVAYEMQVQARRRELHLLAAQTLELLYAADLAPFYGQIGYHYEMAFRQGLFGVQEQAQDYLFKAGEQAAANFENESAVEFFSRALNLVEKDELETRFDLLLAREEASHNGSLREMQRADLGELAAIATQLVDPTRQADTALRRTRYELYVPSDYPATQAAAAEALAVAETSGDLARQATARHYWGEALWRQGDFAAAGEQLKKAVDLAGQAGDHWIEAESLRHQGHVIMHSGDLKAAMSIFEQALTLCRQIGDRRGEAANLNSVGLIHLRSGFLEQALANYKDALGIIQRIGEERGEVIVSSNLGDVSLLLGDWQQALTYAERALQLGQERELAHFQSASMLVLGNVYYHIDQVEAALDYLRPALAHIQELQDWEQEPFALLAVGDALIRQGNMAEAETHYQQLMEKAGARDNDQAQIPALAGLAETALAQQDPKKVQEHTEHLLSRVVRERIDRDFGWVAQYYLTGYRALEALQDERAPAVLQAGFQAQQADAAKIETEELRRSFLENVPVNRELLEVCRQVFPEGVPEAAVDLAALFPPTTYETPAPKNGEQGEPSSAAQEAQPQPGPDVPEATQEEPDPASTNVRAGLRPAPTNINKTETTSVVSELPALPPIAPKPITVKKDPRPEPTQSTVGASVRPQTDPGPEPGPADLSGASLSGAKLNKMNLAGWRLRGADLRGAQLRAADLRNADLRGADLRAVDFRDANLIEADLRGAQLQAADLRGTDLLGAILDGADLTEVITDQETQWPEDNKTL